MKRLPAPLLMALSASLAVVAASVSAKLPAPSDEAKAKAAEAAAKTAHGDKVAAFQLCNAMNRVAVHWQTAAAKAGKSASSAVDTPACADPGPFVAAAAPAAASAPAAAAASAPAPTVAKK